MPGILPPTTVGAIGGGGGERGARPSCLGLSHSFHSEKSEPPIMAKAGLESSLFPTCRQDVIRIPSRPDEHFYTAIPIRVKSHYCVFNNVAETVLECCLSVNMWSSPSPKIGHLALVMLTLCTVYETTKVMSKQSTGTHIFYSPSLLPPPPSSCSWPSQRSLPATTLPFLSSSLLAPTSPHQ